jgi:hypothetical protein
MMFQEGSLAGQERVNPAAAVKLGEKDLLM